MNNKPLILLIGALSACWLVHSEKAIATEGHYYDNQGSSTSSSNEDRANGLVEGGTAAAANHRYDAAIRFYSAALDMRPANMWLADIYRLRGRAYLGKGDREKALADYDHALRLPVKTSDDHYVRAQILEGMGDYRASVREYVRAAELSPNDAYPWNGVAWLKATAPIADVRNAQEAIRAGVKVCELTNWRRGDYIDSLAAAHAEAGNFDEAIRLQERAIKLTEPGDRGELERHLAAYHQHKPHREPVGLHY